MRSRAVLVAVALICTVAAIAGAVVMSRPASFPTTGGIDVAAASRAIQSCMKGDGVGTFKPYDHDCMIGAWESAIDAGALPAFLTAMEQAIERMPTLEIPCHDEAHTAGKYAFDQGTPIEDILVGGTSQKRACDNGVIHGALGAFARSGVGLADLERAVSVCETIAAPGNTGCVHGMGHAAWAATADAENATRACVFFDDMGLRSQCLNGIVMALMSPEHDPSETPEFTELDEAYQRLPGMCNTIVDIGGVGQGWDETCYRFLGSFTVRQLQENSTVEVSAFTGEDNGPVVALLTDALNRCDTLPAGPSRHCAYGVYWIIKASTGVAQSPENLDAARELCRALVVSELNRDECVAVVEDTNW